MSTVFASRLIRNPTPASETAPPSTPPSWSRRGALVPLVETNDSSEVPNDAWNGAWIRTVTTATTAEMPSTTRGWARMYW